MSKKNFLTFLILLTIVVGSICYILRQQIKPFINKYFSNQITVSEIDFTLPEKPIVIITPSFNNSPWYKKNLDSIFNQRYANYRIVYINDASTDGTGELVEQYLKDKNTQHLVTLINNERWLGGSSNLFNAISHCKDNEIVVICDGDDWFVDDTVFALINTVYSQDDVWATYGQYMEWPSKITGCCGPVRWHNVLRNRFREQGWVFSHLRTCYAWLLKKVKLSSILYRGVTFLAPNDCYMPSVVEMAGTHARFISNVLYVLNREPRPPQDRTCYSLAMAHSDYYLNSKKYQPLESKPTNFAFSHSVALLPLCNTKFQNDMLNKCTGVSEQLPYTKNAFKSSVITALQKSKHQYVALLFDTARLTTSIDLKHCAQEIERVHAFCFFPLLKEEAFQDWQELSFTPQTKNPYRKQVAPLGNGTIAFQFEYAPYLWNSSKTLDMIILKRKDAIALGEYQQFSNPRELKEVIAKQLVHRKELGLLFG